jgi:bacillithiol biosynthesis cysteine-adding enzyme BshC
MHRERRTIKWKGEAWSIRGAEPSIRKEELLLRAQEKPSLFSPNVLLRPVYQDALLPTVAYVGGQAEISYFAQMKGVYEAFGLPMPVIYPRKNVTILERKVAQLLERFGLEIPDFWTPPDRLISEASKRHVPDTLEAAMRRAQDDLEKNFESLKGEVTVLEPTLEAWLERARGRMDQQWKYVEKKIRQAAAERNATAVRQLRKAADNLYPAQRLQERVFNIVPYLIKYGFAFLEKLDRDIDIGEHDHQVLLM